MGVLFLFVFKRMLKNAKNDGLLEASGEQARQFNKERERVNERVKEIDDKYEEIKSRIPDNWADVERMRKKDPIKL